ncbi:putative reverse transcriptase domain-containing protein [Tanacetum coccineum]
MVTKQEVKRENQSASMTPLIGFNVIVVVAVCAVTHMGSAESIALCVAANGFKAMPRKLVSSRQKRFICRIVGAPSDPCVNHEKEEATHQHQFIMHAGLDIVQDLAWTTTAMFLKAIDRFNDLVVSIYVTAVQCNIPLEDFFYSDAQSENGGVTPVPVVPELNEFLSDMEEEEDPKGDFDDDDDDDDDFDDMEDPEEEEPQEEEEEPQGGEDPDDDMDVDIEGDENEPELTFLYKEENAFKPPPPTSDAENKDLSDAEERAKCKKLERELEEANVGNTLLQMRNERVERDLYHVRVWAQDFHRYMIRRGIMFEERPSEAIEVPIEKEEPTPQEIMPPKSAPLTQTAVQRMIRESVNAAITAERARNAIAGNNVSRSQVTAPATREYSFVRFMKCNPDTFCGLEGVVELRRWFEKIKITFAISECVEAKKVKFATATLKGPALTWWILRLL